MDVANPSRTTDPGTSAPGVAPIDTETVKQDERDAIEDDDEIDDECDDDEDESSQIGSEGGAGVDGQIAEDASSVSDRQKHAITGRGVTLAMLMADGVIQPGPDAMSIDYLGQKFTADLLDDGRIRWRESETVFSSPSAWAIHCKRIVNPNKKSGCGWASVRYRGKKLDVYKSMWFKKHRPGLASTMNLVETEDDAEDGEKDVKIPKLDCEPEQQSNTVVESHVTKTPDKAPEVEVTNLAVRSPKEKRISVRHNTLGRISRNHDQNILIECVTFTMIAKIQPFNLCISTNCLLLMDFHCHLKSNEVSGYLAGKWDATTQQLNVTSAFPLLHNSSEADKAAIVEDEVRKAIVENGLVVAGWYHSHPFYQPDPSLRDVNAQMEYQFQLKGSPNTFQPCFGCIIAPFFSRVTGCVSEVLNFYVMPPSEQRPLDYGMPIKLQHNLCMESYIPDSIYDEMHRLVKFYREEPEFLCFNDSWDKTTTYRKKFHEILARNCPNGQVDARLLDLLRIL